MNILLVDNYDSFTHNLSHLLQAQRVSVDVIRNDHPSLQHISGYHGIVISPGPGTPIDADYFGYCTQLITQNGTSGTPILGICLGLQGIYHAFGGALKHAEPVHGKVSTIQLTQASPLWAGIPNNTPVMRYHSICADTSQPVPSCLKITAETSEISENATPTPMAIEHKQHPIYGLQFHPESFATRHGAKLIANFLNICQTTPAL